jgi:hypothetical protein
MDLYQKIMASYPDLPQNVFWKRIIILRNDSDGELVIILSNGITSSQYLMGSH